MLKIGPYVRNNLAIGGVIDRFQANDPRFKRRVSLVKISQENQLCNGWTDNQNLIGALQCVRDGVKETMLVVWMIVRSCFVVFRVAMKMVSG